MRRNVFHCEWILFRVRLLRSYLSGDRCHWLWLLLLLLVSGSVVVTGFVAEGIDGCSEESIGNQRTRRGAFLVAVRTLVVIGFQQRSAHTLVAEGTATAGNHYGVVEEVLANATNEIVWNFRFLLGGWCWVRFRLPVRGNDSVNKEEDRKLKLNLQFRLLLIVDEGTRNPGGLPWRVFPSACQTAHGAILNPVARLVALVAAVGCGNFSGLGQTHSLVAEEGRGKEIFPLLGSIFNKKGS